MDYLIAVDSESTSRSSHEEHGLKSAGLLAGDGLSLKSIEKGCSRDDVASWSQPFYALFQS